MKKILAILLVSLFVIPAIFTMAVGVSADDLPFSRVLYAPKTGEAPNLEAIDETWGSPLIHVSDELPEAVLYNYWDPKKPNPNIGAGELATYLASGDYIYAEPSDFMQHGMQNISIWHSSPRTMSPVGHLPHGAETACRCGSSTVTA